MSQLMQFLNFIEATIEQNIVSTSLHENSTVKPTDDTFINNLEKRKITKDDIQNKLSCAICQEEFILDETVIQLPCGNPHFFHCDCDTTKCEGILPWLKEHNTCPVCRHEFPKKEIPESETHSSSSSTSLVSLTTTSSEPNTPTSISSISDTYSSYSDETQAMDIENEENQDNSVNFINNNIEQFINNIHIIPIQPSINIHPNESFLSIYDNDLQHAIQRSLEES